ncbi:uncharacterized protein LOC100908028 [Galendromus occidentalis]|uniref:Uncharacterized protein LOC100908028 n=1 Tax=Galendromus occidentalis TaxID=34638 RepID=A0AAJ6VXI2_9ACAR|nr:uncharacterized protein LOC100908028 [Galendromus occidentalis]
MTPYGILILVSCLAAVALSERDCNRIGDHICLPEERCSSHAVNKEIKSCAQGSVCCHSQKNDIDPCKNRAGGECVLEDCAVEALPGSCPSPQKCCVRLR